MLSCNVEECERPAVVKEIYQGEGKTIEDAVCSYHTGRLGRLPMIGREPVIGEVEYAVRKE